MTLTAQVIPAPYPADSSAAFELLRHGAYPVWLDSSHPQSQRGRFDIMAANPRVTLTTKGNNTVITGQDQTDINDDDPLMLLRAELPEPHVLPEGYTHLPFCGGALGYLGYDLARRFERLPASTNDDLSLPDMWMGIYPWALIIDHYTQTACVAALHGEDVSGIIALLNTEADSAESSDAFIATVFKANISQSDYLDKMATIAGHIREGDCYQVNFAQRFSAQYQGDPYQAYLKLRQASPAPFSAYLELPDNNALLCLSPERFIHYSDGLATTCPIKGTIARGSTEAEDAQLRNTLLTSLKDRAENVMIVDLLRNDLSRTCHKVQTPVLFELQTFANVHHLVSTVTGQLKPGEDAVSLLRTSFPGGSITGAPKIRAMEIIETLETCRRGPYCGSIGYISACGQMDTNIAIRTLICDQGSIHCYGGGGIVFDSDPTAEYQESLTKVRLLMQTLSATEEPLP